MTRRKTFVALSATIVLCVALARTGYSAEICKVISPNRFERLHSFPVSVVVQFSQGARPDTFRASLNGIDITSKFQENRKDELRALIGLEDGLSIEVKTNPQGKINALRTMVRGLKPEQHVDFETFFFVEVDKLTTVGSEGGAIKSLDGDVLTDIPRQARSSPTTIALTKVSGTGQPGSMYHLAPERIGFSRPVTVTMKYHPAKLPPGVTEDDLFLILGDEFPRKLENLFVDKAAHTVSGTIMFFSRVSMSCYMKIGKRLTDIPLATDFRLPIGDNAAAYDMCGRDDQLPSKNDLGEALTLLHRSSYPNFDYPRIILNENGTDNTWHVTRAYNRKRYINSAAGPTRDSRSLYREHEGMFSNGEDWRFGGQRNVHQGFLPVHAIADGLVIYNGRGNGNAVVLAHRIAGGPILSVYSHLGEKSPCAVGTLVHKGNVIGEIGRFGTGDAYLHYGIGKESLIKLDSITGEIKVPAAWFWESKQDSVSETYYDPTSFLFNIMGKHKWDFNVSGNDEGWIARNVKKYENGYTYQVKDGMLSVKPKSSHLQIVSYPLKIEAESFDSMFFRMMSNAPEGHGRVYFATNEEPQYSEDKALGFELLNDGKFHEYKIFMADNHKWKETIAGIRIDVLDAVVGETTEINFDNISIGRAYLSRTPDTGQTKCYDNSHEITCPAPGAPFYGQDANYAINPPTYEVKAIDGHEMVVDQVTGLTWQRHNDGIKRTWQEAMDYCENLALAGYSDWRLPTKKELQTIANYGGSGPAVDVAYFPYRHVPDDCYWSATSSAFLALSAWKVCLSNSQVSMSLESDHNDVRAVRGRSLEFSRFKDNGDGTITDLTTGLVWQQTETKAMTWEEALAYCEGLVLAGYYDWRLPNIRELLSLVDDSRHKPSADTTYFPGCRPSIYWSSTTNTAYPGFAWYVDFNHGLVHGGGHKGRRHYVRAVRDEH